MTEFAVRMRIEAHRAIVALVAANPFPRSSHAQHNAGLIDGLVCACKMRQIPVVSVEKN